MSRYQPLADFLATQKTDQWEATFAEIEAQLGFSLPDSAYRHPAWWANQSGAGHSQTAGWKRAGWRTAGLDLEHRRVRFERDEAHEHPSRPLFQRARELTGIRDRDKLIEAALSALIAREAGKRLAALGGTMHDFAAAPRERSDL